jgi:HTH-type transcriptional regulator/antitoxin MqsA
MKCPECFEADLVLKTEDMPYEYKGHKFIIPSVTGEYCQACGESVLSADESRRVSAAMSVFNMNVDAEIAKEIHRIRKKLKLRQRDAGEIFGGGVNAFSRYEKGIVKPPTLLVKTLRVLDLHPELLAEYKGH